MKLTHKLQCRIEFANDWSRAFALNSQFIIQLQHSRSLDVEGRNGTEKIFESTVNV